MTFWKPEYANIGGFGDPTVRYPLGEDMTGFAESEGSMTDDKPSSVFDWRRPAKESIGEDIREAAQRSARATKVLERHRLTDPDYGKISKLSKPHQRGLLDPRQFTVYSKVKTTKGN